MEDNTFIAKLNNIIESGGGLYVHPLIIICNDDDNKEYLKSQIDDELIMDIAKLKDKIIPFAQIISNIILGSMLSFSGTIKYGPIGVISSIVSVVLNQILNFLYEKNSKENNLQNKSVTNNYEEGFVAWGLGEVIYIFPIMIIGLIIEKVDWYFYIKNLYIPFFMSFLLAPYRMEAYGLKNYARDEYGVIANICSLVVTFISVFITPLFDNTTNNTSLTYYSVFPLITSIICNKLINNPGYIKQIWDFSFGKQNKVTYGSVEVTLNNLD